MRLSAMKRIPFLILLLPFVFSLASCETDFDITAGYKDITVVYGILSQNDSIHYLRINKAFLGSGNAVEYSQIPDSSSYGGNIEVTLEEVTGDGTGNILTFDTITLAIKDSGAFYYPDHLYYIAKGTLNPTATYNLKIVNKKNGKVVSSSTKLVQDFNISNPNYWLKTLNFKKANTTTQKFEWESAENGRLYQPVLYYFYKETSSPGDTIVRKVEWKFPAKRSSSLDGGKAMSVEYLNADFYARCTAQIPYADAAAEEAVIARVADHLELIFTVVGDDFNTYIEVNEPTTGVLMEKPEYSNITNGIGLFSSRYQKKSDYMLGKDTQLDLYNNTNLKFVRPVGD